MLAAAYAVFALACVVGLVGHGWPAVAAMAVLLGAQAPLVSSMEGSLMSSLVDEPRLGTAFGILNAINGVGDLASSVAAGALWTFVNPAAALALGMALSVVAAAALLRTTPGR